VEKKCEYNGTVCELLIDFKKVTIEVLCNILIKLLVPMKLVRLMKMCLNETYNKISICKDFSDAFCIWGSLRQGDALSPLLFNLVLEYTIRKG
jgi:hypothetical protein